MIRRIVTGPGDIMPLEVVPVSYDLASIAVETVEIYNMNNFFLILKYCIYLKSSKFVESLDNNSSAMTSISLLIQRNPI